MSHPALYSLGTGAFPRGEMARSKDDHSHTLQVFTQENVLNLHIVGKCYNTVMLVRGKHIDPVKNMGLFHCMA